MFFVRAALFVVTIVAGIILSAAPAIAQDNEKPEIRNRYDFSEGMFETKPGKMEFLWTSRIYGEFSKLETQSAEVGGLGVNGFAKYTLLEGLEARAFLRGRFESGRSQSFFGDIEPASGVYVVEAAIKYSPFLTLGYDILDVKAGVINQDWLDMPILIARRSFPGVSADVHYDWTPNVRTGFVSQYTIPTSQTLSPRTIEQEPTPSFTTQTLFASWRSPQLEVRGTANYYEYKDLPSFVAFESQRRGNDPLFIGGPNNSEFRFPFRGWFTQGKVEGEVAPRFRAGTYINVIKNEEAPHTFNDGQVLGLQFLLRSQPIDYQLSLEKVHIESDAVPGAYNAWGYGNTNKEGYGGTFDLIFNKKNFRVRAQYYDMRLINANPIQQDQQYFLFRGGDRL